MPIYGIRAPLVYLAVVFTALGYVVAVSVHDPVASILGLLGQIGACFALTGGVVVALNSLIHRLAKRAGVVIK